MGQLGGILMPATLKHGLSRGLGPDGLRFGGLLEKDRPGHDGVWIRWWFSPVSGEYRGLAAFHIESKTWKCVTDYNLPDMEERTMTGEEVDRLHSFYGIDRDNPDPRDYPDPLHQNKCVA